MEPDSTSVPIDANIDSEAPSTDSSEAAYGALLEDPDVYIVEKIRDWKVFKTGVGKRRRSVVKYFVKWENYDDTWNTWEPHDNLHSCPSVLEEFIAQMSEKDRKAHNLAIMGDSGVAARKARNNSAELTIEAKGKAKKNSLEGTESGPSSSKRTSEASKEGSDSGRKRHKSQSSALSNLDQEILSPITSAPAVPPDDTAPLQPSLPDENRAADDVISGNGPQDEGGRYFVIMPGENRRADDGNVISGNEGGRNLVISEGETTPREEIEGGRTLTALSEEGLEVAKTQDKADKMGYESDGDDPEMSTEDDSSSVDTSSDDSSDDEESELMDDIERKEENIPQIELNVAELQNASDDKLYNYCAELKIFFQQEIDAIVEEAKKLKESDSNEHYWDDDLPLPVADCPPDLVRETLAYKDGQGLTYRARIEEIGREAGISFNKQLMCAAKLGNPELFLQIWETWAKEEGVTEPVSNRSDLWSIEAGLKERAEFEGGMSDNSRKKVLFLRKVQELTTDRFNVTLLMSVAWERTAFPCTVHNHGYCKILSFLASRMSSEYVNAKTETTRWTALMMASKLGSACQVKALLEVGAHVSPANDLGRCALHIAAERGDLEIVRWLVLNGGNIAQEDRKKVTPRLLAQKEEFDDAVEAWMRERQKGLDNILKVWTEKFCDLDGLMKRVKGLTPVHVQPLNEGSSAACFELRFSVAAKESGSIFSDSDQEDGVTRPLLAIFLAYYSDEESNRSAENPSLVQLKWDDFSTNSESVLTEIFSGPPRLEVVSLNGFHQCNLTKDNRGEGNFATWMFSLRHLRKGKNRMKFVMSGGRTTSDGKSVMMFLQPVLCRLNQTVVAEEEQKLYHSHPTTTTVVDIN